MTLAATVFGATLHASIGLQFSETLKNLVATLVTTHNWTIIGGAYNNGLIGAGGAPTTWVGATNNWDTEAHISLDTGSTNYRAWIVLRNGDSTYLVISLHTWAAAGTCACNFLMSKDISIAGSVGSVGTRGWPARGTDSVWCYNNAGGLTDREWDQSACLRSATNATKQVIWADSNSFFMCNVPSGNVKASGYAMMLKLNKTDANDPMPYVIGTYAGTQSTATYSLAPTAATQSGGGVGMYGRTGYPVNMGVTPAVICNGTFFYPCYTCISAVAAAAKWSNNSLAILQDVDGNKMEWEIQVWTEIGSATSRFRRGVLPDIRLCAMTGGVPNTDGTLNTGSTRVSIGEWSFPWSGALTWPAP